MSHLIKREVIIFACTLLKCTASDGGIQSTALSNELLTECTNQVCRNRHTPNPKASCEESQQHVTIVGHAVSTSTNPMAERTAAVPASNASSTASSSLVNTSVSAATHGEAACPARTASLLAKSVSERAKSCQSLRFAGLREIIAGLRSTRRDLSIGTLFVSQG